MRQANSIEPSRRSTLPTYPLTASIARRRNALDSMARCRAKLAISVRSCAENRLILLTARSSGASSRVCVRLLVHERERVIVLPIKIQKTCRAVGIAVADLEILGQCDAVREHGIDITRNSFTRVKMQRRAPSHKH